MVIFVFLLRRCFEFETQDGAWYVLVNHGYCLTKKGQEVVCVSGVGQKSLRIRVRNVSVSSERFVEVVGFLQTRRIRNNILVCV